MAEEPQDTGLLSMTLDQAEVAWQRVKQVCSGADPYPNPPAMDYILMPEYEGELLQACQAAVAAGRSEIIIAHYYCSWIFAPRGCHGSESVLQ